MRLEAATDREALARFIAAHADPVDDLLVHADVGPPLGRLTTSWFGREDGEVRAVAFAFPLWPASPALGVKGLTREDEAAAIRALAEVGPPVGYVICAEAQRPLWEAAGRAEAGHREWQMVLDAAGWRPEPRAGVRDASPDELDAFYREHHAGAWHPIQVETGPYVVIERDGRIVAAAGTHFAYAGLAQIGNVLTAPGCRGQGLAALCTAAMVDRLTTLGYPTISLFVAEENAVARRVYERLGFKAHRPLAAFRWEAGQRPL